MKKPIESKAWIYPIQENAHDESYFYSKEVGWNHEGVSKGIITEWGFLLAKKRTLYKSRLRSTFIFGNAK